MSDTAYIVHWANSEPVQSGTVYSLVMTYGFDEAEGFWESHRSTNALHSVLRFKRVFDCDCVYCRRSKSLQVFHYNQVMAPLVAIVRSYTVHTRQSVLV